MPALGHDAGTLPRAYAATDAGPRVLVDLNAPPAEVWEVFWYRGPDRPQAKIGTHRDPASRRRGRRGPRAALHVPGAEVPPARVASGQSWEWLTEVKPLESWRYDAIGKPLWSRADGPHPARGPRRRPHARPLPARSTRLQPVDAPARARAATCTSSISRDNDTILAALEGGLAWHRKRREREARPRPRARPTAERPPDAQIGSAPTRRAWPCSRRGSRRRRPRSRAR